MHNCMSKISLKIYQCFFFIYVRNVHKLFQKTDRIYVFLPIRLKLLYYKQVQKDGESHIAHSHLFLKQVSILRMFPMEAISECHL